MTAKVEVPKGVQGEVARVLRAATLYDVLEVTISPFLPPLRHECGH